METHDGLVLIGMLIGLVGIVLLVVPGMTLQLVAAVFWGFAEGSAQAWAVVALIVVIGVVVAVVKYARPGRRLREAGVPRRTLLLALATGMVGFLVIPVVGAIVGFVGAVYYQERGRVGPGQAWQSTRNALSAVALSIGIELAGGFLILAIWLVAALIL